jgi:hypothetical protein
VKYRLLPKDQLTSLDIGAGHEMLSKVDSSTETPWDQGPRLAPEGAFLATCVFGTL